MWQQIVACIVATLWMTVAASAQIPVQSETYRYSAANREIADVLRGFAADQRLNIVLDPTIGGQLISEEVELPPAEFLDYITGKYGLVWYYDGTSLYVYHGSSLSTRAFRLRYATPSRVIDTMKQINAYSDRFSYRVLEKEKVILAIGPPRMLDMTALVVGTLEASAQTTATSSLSIAVFPLRFASAADQDFNFEGSSVVVPGVASILQNLVAGNNVPGRVSTFLPRNLPGLSGYGLNRFSQTPEAKLFSRLQPPISSPNLPPPSSDGAPPPADVTESGEDADGQETNQSSTNVNAQQLQPTISADTRTNSVIVRDLPERMESYQQVINALDQPTGLIEITARIIDITKEGVFEWGLPHDLQLNLNDTTRQLTTSLTTSDTANLAVTLLKDEATQFMLQIKALEQDGYARVASRPSLLTLDNVEAQIDNSETFFVRVEGDFEVELFDVSIGTTLNIIPHIIEQDGKRLIRLNVQVTDGSVLEQTVDEIPRIRSDSITTQAMLGEHESLLIGGLFREEKSSSISRVPVLGRLPGVGALFRSEEFNTSRVERVILIEPRIVASPVFENGAMKLKPLDTSHPTFFEGETFEEEISTPTPQPQILPPEDLPQPEVTTSSSTVSVRSTKSKRKSTLRFLNQEQTTKQDSPVIGESKSNRKADVQSPSIQRAALLQEIPQLIRLPPP